MWVQGNLSDTVFEKCVQAAELNKIRTVSVDDMRNLHLSPNSFSSFRKINSITETKHVKQKCNSDYFSNMDSDFKWYIVGLLYADGNLYFNKGLYGEVVLQLQERDKPILDIIGKSIYKTAFTLHFVKKTSEARVNNYRLCIRDKQIIRDLQEIGLQPKKSLILTFPEVPDEFLKSFIHGYIDGDGCLFESNYTNYCELLSTLEFCNIFKLKIDSLLNIKSRVFRKKNIFNWKLQKQSELITFLDWLYEDYTFGLDRKYEKYLKIKNNINLKLNK